MLDLTHLDTPAALLESEPLHRNINHMQQQVSRLGARLRPHVKTAKCLPVAQLQRDAGAVGITVSTLKEAETFFAAGFDDILYAVGIAPNKLDAVAALRRQGCRLSVVLDSVEAAAAVAAKSRACTAQGESALVAMIEIDSDGHRAGVKPDDEALLLAIGRTLHDGGATLLGVMTHCGASYSEHTPQGLQRMAEQERFRCVQAAERLRAAGLPCPEVSVGSTPTALSATSLQGVTEVRAGVYVFNDLVMCNIGVAQPQDVALSVLTSVIGHQLEKGWVLVDAGWMAMSRDRGTQAQAVDYGYGAVCDVHGKLLPGWTLVQANQEHGVMAAAGAGVDGADAGGAEGATRADRAAGISGAAVAGAGSAGVGGTGGTVGMPAAASASPGLSGEALRQRFPVGTLLRVLPNHACATAAQFGRYHVVQGQQQVAEWERFNGW